MRTHWICSSHAHLLDFHPAWPGQAMVVAAAAATKAGLFSRELVAKTHRKVRRHDSLTNSLPVAEPGRTI